MPDVAAVLKEEIRRLARKEVKQLVSSLEKDNRLLKKTVSAQRKRLDRIEKQVRNRQAAAVADSAETDAADDAAEGSRARISAKAIRELRQKFGMSREAFGKLLGVSSQSIYQWERQEGRLNLRSRTKAAVVDVRKMGKREANRMLEQTGESAPDTPAKDETAPAPKRRGRRKAADKASAPTGGKRRGRPRKQR